MGSDDAPFVGELPNFTEEGGGDDKKSAGSDSGLPRSIYRMAALQTGFLVCSSAQSVWVLVLLNCSSASCTRSITSLVDVDAVGLVCSACWVEVGDAVAATDGTVELSRFCRHGTHRSLLSRLIA